MVIGSGDGGNNHILGIGGGELLIIITHSIYFDDYFFIGVDALHCCAIQSDVDTIDGFGHIGVITFIFENGRTGRHLAIIYMTGGGESGVLVGGVEYILGELDYDFIDGHISIEVILDGHIDGE